MTPNPGAIRHEGCKARRPGDRKRKTGKTASVVWIACVLILLTFVNALSFRGWKEMWSAHPFRFSHADSDTVARTGFLLVLEYWICTCSALMRVASPAVHFFCRHYEIVQASYATVLLYGVTFAFLYHKPKIKIGGFRWEQCLIFNG